MSVQSQCLTYDPKKLQWIYEELSKVEMQKRRDAGFGCITEADDRRDANLRDRMEKAAAGGAGLDLDSALQGKKVVKVWDRGQFVAEARRGRG